MDYRNERDALRGRVENLEQELGEAKRSFQAQRGGGKAARVAQLEEHLAEAQRLLDDVRREFVAVKGAPEAVPAEDEPRPIGGAPRPDLVPGRRGRGRGVLLFGLALAVLLVAVGIRRDWFTHADYYKDATSIPTKLAEKMGTPLRVRYLLVYSDYVVTEIEDPKKPGNVDRYVLRDGDVGDGEPVKRGDGPSVDLATVSFDAVPRMVADATMRLHIEDGKVANASLNCNAVGTGKAAGWRVSVSGPRKDGSVEYDTAGHVVKVGD
jgi:hypothetical protein